jgi:hypothetical protein
MEKIQCPKCDNWDVATSVPKGPVMCLNCRHKWVPEVDLVNNPPHYNSSPAKCSQCLHPIECIEVTRHMSFNLGNAVKYLWRWQNKGGLEDLKKARWYLEDAINELEKKEILEKKDE